MAERIQGTVKWFSNRKGYGFLTTEDGADVFCHFSEVDCGDAYQSLNKGWIVEFSVEKDQDDNFKPKAVHVTAVGGGPCTGPGRSTRRKVEKDRSHRSTPWHEGLDDHCKSVLNIKSISTDTGTLDISVANVQKLKLGTAAYASMAHANGIVAEGTFTFDPVGIISLDWARAIEFVNGAWQERSVIGLLSSFSLLDDTVQKVGRNETPSTLWGADKPNPRPALEANGFQMRKVYLQRTGRNRKTN